MQWSKLNGAQRAFAQTCGREVVATLKALDRDADRAAKREHVEANRALIAAALANPVTHKVTTCKAGKAYGSVVRPKARALPMQFFRAGGGI